MASSIFLYGIIVLTGPNASMSCTAVFENGSEFNIKIGLINAPFSLFPEEICTSSGFPNTISCWLASSATFSRTSLNCVNPAKAPIRTPSTWGSPMTVFSRRLPRAICTSSTKFSGTIILRIAVHFCPHLTVISLWTSLTKRSNSGVPGTAS